MRGMECVFLLSVMQVPQLFKLCLTRPTAQGQPNSSVTDITLTDRQRLKDDHLSTSSRFFNLPLGIGWSDRGLPFKWSSKPLCICLYLGLNQGPLCFLATCFTY